MKKGSFVVIEKENGTSILGTIVSDDIDGNTISLKGVGETNADNEELIKRERVGFTCYPKKTIVIVNLWTIRQMFEWTGKPPRGWKAAVAEAEERDCSCDGEDDEEDDDDD